VAKKATRRLKAKKLKPVKATKAKRAKVQRRATRKRFKSIVARDAFPGAKEMPVADENSKPVSDIL
jgi:hypothetical protein